MSCAADSARAVDDLAPTVASLKAVEQTGVWAETLLKQPVLSRPSDTSVTVVRCYLKDGQDNSLVKVVKTGDDGLADPRGAVMSSCLEKGRQGPSVAPSASDEPGDRFLTDARVVMSKAPQELVCRMQGLRYAPSGGPRSILGYPWVVVRDGRDPLNQADVDGVRTVLSRQLHKGKRRTRTRRAHHST